MSNFVALTPAASCFLRMPSLLTDYLTALDATPVAGLQNRDVVAEFGRIAEELEAAGDQQSARQARIEQEVMGASKSLEDKIGYHISGVRKDEDGNEHPFGWPDTSAYGPAEYEYLKQRYQVTNNLFLKREYGLFLYLRKQAGRPEEVATLVRDLFALSQEYFTLEATESPTRHYVLFAVQNLALAFRIAASRQRDPAVAVTLRPIMDFMLATQQRWDATRTGSPMLLGTFTSMVAEQLNLFQEAGLVPAFLDRNRPLIEALRNTYLHGAMEVAQATAEVAQQAKLDARPWQLLVADYYEQLAAEALARNSSAAVSFTQQALRLYQELGETATAERLAQQYQQLRTSFRLGEVSTEVPAEQVQERMAEIQRMVEHNTEEQLVTLLAAAPMFPTIEAVREYEQTATTSLADMFPTVVQDKHGNPVQTFTTEEEKREFRLLNAYGLLGQLATQSLVQLVVTAYKADKLHVSSIMGYLAESWLAQPREVREHGVERITFPLRLLESGIKAIFHELDRWRQGETDDPDFIAATDSLVLKVEYVLRYMCGLLGITTFRLKREDGIVHEKLLEELLRDLAAHLDPEDVFFIRFYMHEKAGQNLRNRVAHGLMDENEYGIEKALLVLVMLLKLAGYAFKPRETEPS
jgi:hypothetical protein